MSDTHDPLEVFMARLLTDAAYRQAFLEDPRAVLATMPLSPAQRESCLAINPDHLQRTAESFAAKRQTRTKRRGPTSMLQRLKTNWSRLLA